MFNTNSFSKIRWVIFFFVLISFISAPLGSGMAMSGDPDSKEVPPDEAGAAQDPDFDESKPDYTYTGSATKIPNSWLNLLKNNMGILKMKVPPLKKKKDLGLKAYVVTDDRNGNFKLHANEEPLQTGELINIRYNYGLAILSNEPVKTLAVLRGQSGAEKDYECVKYGSAAMLASDLGEQNIELIQSSEIGPNEDFTLTKAGADTVDGKVACILRLASEDPSGQLLNYMIEVSEEEEYDVMSFNDTAFKDIEKIGLKAYRVSDLGNNHFTLRAKAQPINGEEATISYHNGLLFLAEGDADKTYWCRKNHYHNPLTWALEPNNIKLIRGTDIGPGKTYMLHRPTQVGIEPIEGEVACILRLDSEMPSGELEDFKIDVFDDEHADHMDLSLNVKFDEHDCDKEIKLTWMESNLDNVRGEKATFKPADYSPGSELKGDTIPVLTDKALNAKIMIEGGPPPYFLYGDFDPNHPGFESQKKYEFGPGNDKTTIEITKEADAYGKLQDVLIINNLKMDEEPFEFTIRHNAIAYHTAEEADEMDLEYTAYRDIKIAPSCLWAKVSKLRAHLRYWILPTDFNDQDLASGGNSKDRIRLLNSAGETLADTGDHSMGIWGIIENRSPEFLLSYDGCLMDVAGFSYSMNAKGGGEDPDFSIIKLLVMACADEDKIVSNTYQNNGATEEATGFPSDDSDCLYAAEKGSFEKHWGPFPDNHILFEAMPYGYHHMKTEWGTSATYKIAFDENCYGNQDSIIWCPPEKNPFPNHTSWWTHANED